MLKQWLYKQKIYTISPIQIITRVGAIVALILILGIVKHYDEVAKQESLIAELARYELPMDCNFETGAHPHVWEDACEVRDGMVVIR